MCILIVCAELVRGCGQLKELKQTQLRKQKTASTWHAHHNILQALQQLCLPVRSEIMSMVSFGTYIYNTNSYSLLNLQVFMFTVPLYVGIGVLLLCSVVAAMALLIVCLISCA